MDRADGMPFDRSRDFANRIRSQRSEEASERYRSARGFIGERLVGDFLFALQMSWIASTLVTAN